MDKSGPFVVAFTLLNKDQIFFYEVEGWTEACLKVGSLLKVADLLEESRITITVEPNVNAAPKI